MPRYQRIASLLTVHNLSYQGQFWHWDMLLTGLDWKYFNWHQMEFHGNLNLLKTGMVFADSISTVSPRYAQEIQSSPLGCGLEGVLQYRHDVLSGILNGIDPHEWDPATDPHLAANYNAETVGQGKPLCKAALQKELGLPQEPAAPLVGIVGPADRPEGVRPGGRRDAALGADQRRAMGHFGHRPAEISQAAGDPGRAVPADEWPCGWSSPIRWPIASRPAPTSSSCPAASSRAG